MGSFGVDRGAQVTGVACASLALPWLAVVLRAYVRIGIQKFFGLEDYLTVASVAIFTVLCGVILSCLEYGLGAHIYNISDNYLESLAKYIFVSELLYVVTTAVTKFAIGMYFFRLANKRYQFYLIYITLALVGIFSTAYFLFLLFQCSPIHLFWDHFVKDTSGYCVSKSALASVTYTHAAISAITDWIFGLLPISFVWNLRMNTRTKYSVFVILSLGFFASSATLVRIYYIDQLQHSTDYTWHGINLVKWSLIEPAIALTAASFATLRPLFQKSSIHRRTFSDDSTSSSSEPITNGNYDYLRPFNGEEYSAQFADMLGLKRLGVTTLVYSDRIVLEGEENDGDQHGWTKEEGGEGGDRITSADRSRNVIMDWNMGVRTTTVVQTIE